MLHDLGEYDGSIASALEPGEEIHTSAPAVDALVALTNTRLMVVESHRVALAVAYSGIRRIQFDLERTRPATLVIVPEKAERDAQVLSIEPEHYGAVADALAKVGHALVTTPSDGPSA